MVGLVEAFDQTMQDLAEKLNAAGLPFQPGEIHANRARQPLNNSEEDAKTSEIETILAQANADDLALVQEIAARFAAKADANAEAGPQGSEPAVTEQDQTKDGGEKQGKAPAAPDPAQMETGDESG